MPKLRFALLLLGVNAAYASASGVMPIVTRFVASQHIHDASNGSPQNGAGFSLTQSAPLRIGYCLREHEVRATAACAALRIKRSLSPFEILIISKEKWTPYKEILDAQERVPQARGRILPNGWKVGLGCMYSVPVLCCIRK